MENNVDNIVDLQWPSLVAFSIASNKTQTEAHTVHGIFGPMSHFWVHKKSVENSWSLGLTQKKGLPSINESGT